MDDIDGGLVKLLAQNARMPVATLAKRLGIARSTVLVQMEPRATPAILARLKAMPRVERAITTSGRFDLVLDIAAPTTEDIDTALDEIGAIPGVTDSESLIHLSTRIDRAL